jgi:hypothetical protein
MINYLQEFTEKIPEFYKDPFTKLKPRGEEQLTAVFVVMHQMGKIDWRKVRYVPIGKTPLTPQTGLIEKHDIILPEHRLFQTDDQKSERWANLRPDVFFINKELNKIVLVEAKIDSNFTSGNFPPDSQITRYLEFLESLTIPMKSLILLCPRFNHEWYVERVAHSAEWLHSPVSTYALDWEEVFHASFC